MIALLCWMLTAGVALAQDAPTQDEVDAEVYAVDGPPSSRRPVYGGFHWGYASNVNDPFVRRRGLHGGMEIGPRPEVLLGARLGVYPIFNQADWKPLTTQLVEELRIAPDLSRITARGELYLRLAPLQSERGDWQSDVGLLTGVGVVRTVDDLEMLQAEGDPIAISTQTQLHRTIVLGVSGGVWWKMVGLRMDATRLHYTEVVNGETLESKRPVFLGLEMSVRVP